MPRTLWREIGTSHQDVTTGRYHKIEGVEQILNAAEVKVGNAPYTT